MEKYRTSDASNPDKCCGTCRSRTASRFHAPPEQQMLPTNPVLACTRAEFTTIAVDSETGLSCRCVRASWSCDYWRADADEGECVACGTSKHPAWCRECGAAGLRPYA